VVSKAVDGSSILSPVENLVAQLAEHLAVNQKVTGSSPV
tara:strand:- start:575 stop:691 length:117 start_codon:yes stop_codon:yes gene_type:complete